MEPTLDDVVRRATADCPDAAQLRRLLAPRRSDAWKLVRAFASAGNDDAGRRRSLHRARASADYGRLRLIAAGRLLARWCGPECNVLDYLAFWEHAAATAVLAAAAVDERRLANEAFTAGFALHLGRIALDRYAPDSLCEAIALADRERIGVVDAEREVLGFTEIEIAALVGSELQLPRRLVAAIGFPAPQHPMRPFEFPEVVVTACAAADVLGVPTGTGVCDPATAVTRSYVEGLLEAVWPLGGRRWLDRHIERIVSSVLMSDESSSAG